MKRNPCEKEYKCKVPVSMSAGAWIDGLLPSDTQCAECRNIMQTGGLETGLETLPRKICPASFVKSISRLSAVWGDDTEQQK
jgi:hypothetical protein